MVWGARRGIDDILGRIHANDPSLASLCLLPGRVFGDAEAVALCHALEANTSLRELTITSHSVSPAAAGALAQALAANSSLHSLALGTSEFGDEALEALAPGVAASASLLRLDLSGRGITSSGCAALAAALAGSGRQAGGLHELLLGQNALGAAGVEALGPAFGALSTLRELELSNCLLEGGVAAEQLAALLRQLPALQRLHLSGNALGPEGGSALAQALGTSGAPTLQQLHMAECGLEAAGAAALAQQLPPALEVLDLSTNSLGQEGAAALAAALASGVASALRRLVLCSAALDEASVAALATGISAGKSSRRSAAAAGESKGLALDLSGNAAGVEALAALAAAPLHALTLHNCGLGDSGAAALAQLLLAAPPAGETALPNGAEGTGSSRGCCFQMLRDLDLSANGIEAAPLLALLAALGSSPAACPLLENLVVAANPGLADPGTEAAVEALQQLRPALQVVRRAADSGEAGK